MELIIMLLVLLVAARVAGEVVERLGQPAIIGELLAGIALGPTLICLIDPLNPDTDASLKLTLDIISMLAIFFVVFYAGLELKMEDFIETMKGSGMFFALGSFIITFWVGFGAGLYFMDNYTSAAFMGLCIAITALPVSVKILSDLGKIHTKTGNAIIGTAMVHDIIAITMLSVIIGLNTAGGMADPFTLTVMMLKIALFLMIIFAFERSFHLKDGWLASKLINLMNKIKSKEAQFSIAIIVSMYLAVLAEFLGLSYIIGAFYGGLIFSSKIVGDKNFLAIKRGTSGIAMGFFAPIFIAYLGLMFNLWELLPIMTLFLVILALAMTSRFSSGYLGARMAGYSNDEAKIVGVGLNAMGMMEMVVALIGFQHGFIGQNFFTILVGMALISTLITPSLLKYLYKKLPDEPPPAEQKEEVFIQELREWLAK
ncbi:MAG: cation:proton antiporter [Thermoplasmata archaeon]|nr:cation:proton antiporter [Thermoplasmata archaeon]